METFNQPLVCIGVPVYNGEKTLSKTLISLLNQDYVNCKIIICDNCSEDNTKQLVSQFIEAHPEKISYLINPNRGTAENNWNFLLDHINLDADYIAIYHADDIYDFNIVSKQVEVLQENGTGAAFTLSRTIDENDNIIDKGILDTIPGVGLGVSFQNFSYASLIEEILKYHNFIRTPSFMCKAIVLKQLDLKFSEEFVSSADLDVWLRIAKHSGITVINELLFSYRISKYQGSYLLKQRRELPADFFKVMDSHLVNSQTTLKNLEWYETYRTLDKVMCALNAARNDSWTEAKRILANERLISAMPKATRIRFGFKQIIFGFLLKTAMRFGLGKRLLLMLRL